MVLPEQAYGVMAARTFQCEWEGEQVQHRKHPEGGFTLLESLVALAIFAIALAAVMRASAAASAGGEGSGRGSYKHIRAHETKGDLRWRSLL